MFVELNLAFTAPIESSALFASALPTIHRLCKGYAHRRRRTIIDATEDGEKRAAFIRHGGNYLASSSICTINVPRYSPSTRRRCSSRISSAMLVRDRRTSSANGAFGRHERHDNAGMRLVTAASW